MSLLISLLLPVVLGQNNNNLTLTLLPETTTGGRCLDGSMSGFYYGPPPSGSSTLWTIYLQGGGACYSKETCDSRANSSLGSSNYWPKQEKGTGSWSIDPNENPDFYQAHHVYIRYCSGDTHRGQRTTPTQQTWGYYFSGHLIIDNIIKYLIKEYELDKAENVLLSGCSAGGIGTFANLDFISRALPNVTVKGAPIAGWFYAGNCTDEQNQTWAPPNDYPHWVSNETGGPDHTPYTDILWDSYIDPDCAAKEDIAWHCTSVHNAFKYIKSPVFVLENQYDKQQLNGEFGLPKKVNATTKDYVKYFGTQMYYSMVNQIDKSSGNGLFLGSCYDHCTGIGYGNSASTTTINGYNVTQVLGDWFFQRNTMTHVLIDQYDSSHDLPDNPSCNSYGN